MNRATSEQACSVARAQFGATAQEQQQQKQPLFFGPLHTPEHLSFTLSGLTAPHQSHLAPARQPPGSGRPLQQVEQEGGEVGPGDRFCRAAVCALNVVQCSIRSIQKCIDVTKTPPAASFSVHTWQADGRRQQQADAGCLSPCRSIVQRRRSLGVGGQRRGPGFQQLSHAVGMAAREGRQEVGFGAGGAAGQATDATNAAEGITFTAPPTPLHPCLAASASAVSPAWSGAFRKSVGSPPAACPATSSTTASAAAAPARAARCAAVRCFHSEGRSTADGLPDATCRQAEWCCLGQDRKTGGTWAAAAADGQGATLASPASPAALLQHRSAQLHAAGACSRCSPSSGALRWSARPPAARRRRRRRPSVSGTARRRC